MLIYSLSPHTKDVLINTRSTSTNIVINTWSTLDQLWVDSQPSVDQLMCITEYCINWINWHCKHLLTPNWLLTECWLCQSSINKSFNCMSIGFQLRLWINTGTQKPLHVHGVLMIPMHCMGYQHFEIFQRVWDANVDKENHYN